MSYNQSGLQLKYFVLKPRGESAYARASRIAMRAYAEAIQAHNSSLARDLKMWVEGEADPRGEAKP
jgi:hypothetical protein